jgi:hypothetical protein
MQFPEVGLSAFRPRPEDYLPAGERGGLWKSCDLQGLILELLDPPGRMQFLEVGFNAFRLCSAVCLPVGGEGCAWFRRPGLTQGPQCHMTVNTSHNSVLRGRSQSSQTLTSSSIICVWGMGGWEWVGEAVEIIRFGGPELGVLSPTWQKTQ